MSIALTPELFCPAKNVVSLGVGVRTAFCTGRDIKLENTLLDASKRLVKITDFGYAKGQEDSVPISNVGTPNYAGDISTSHRHKIVHCMGPCMAVVVVRSHSTPAKRKRHAPSK